MTLQDYFRERVSQEAFDLFAVFARFEYAMKQGGFRRQNSAEAAWHTFAERLPGDFFDRMSAAPEAAIYVQVPPDHLVCDGTGGVRWSGAGSRPSNLAELFGSIKTARNNLFHGDKRHDSRRDTELMAAALFVLNATYAEVETEPAFESFVTAMEYGL